MHIVFLLIFSASSFAWDSHVKKSKTYYSKHLVYHPISVDVYMEQVGIISCETRTLFDEKNNVGKQAVCSFSIYYNQLHERRLTGVISNNWCLSNKEEIIERSQVKIDRTATMEYRSRIHWAKSFLEPHGNLEQLEDSFGLIEHKLITEIITHSTWEEDLETIKQRCHYERQFFFNAIGSFISLPGKIPMTSIPSSVNRASKY